MFSYGRGGGLRAETFGAMFSTGRGKGKDKGKVFGKWRLENVDIYDMVPHLIPKLRKKTLSKNK